MAEPELSLQSLRLDALPEFEPPASLWPRIQQAHARRLRRRRLLRWSAAAAVVVGVALGIGLQRSPTDHTLAQLEADSRALEQAYAQLPHAVDIALDGELELRVLERSLQRAYDRGASAEELLPLWRQRVELLGSLIAVSAEGAQLTRI